MVHCEFTAPVARGMLLTHQAQSLNPGKAHETTVEQTQHGLVTHAAHIETNAHSNRPKQAKWFKGTPG